MHNSTDNCFFFFERGGGGARWPNGVCAHLLGGEHFVERLSKILPSQKISTSQINAGWNPAMD